MGRRSGRVLYFVPTSRPDFVFYLPGLAIEFPRISRRAPADYRASRLFHFASRRRPRGDDDFVALVGHHGRGLRLQEACAAW